MPPVHTQHKQETQRGTKNSFSELLSSCRTARVHSRSPLRPMNLPPLALSNEPQRSSFCPKPFPTLRAPERHEHQLLFQEEGSVPALHRGTLSTEPGVPPEHCQVRTSQKITFL